MKAIILVAGFGTRLYPLTQNMPKTLLKLGRKTILDHLVEKLDSARVIDEIILMTNGRFQADFLKWCQESDYKKPIRILTNGVSEPQKSLGAVRDLNFALRSNYLRGDDALVICGDNYFDFPLGHFLLPCLGHRRNVFVGVYDARDPSIASQCGVVVMNSENQITDFEEKPAHPKSTKISTGVYYLPRAYRLRLYEYLEIQKLPPEKIGDWVSWLVKKRTERVYGIDFDGTWVDIGTKESYEQARRHLNVSAVS